MQSGKKNVLDTLNPWANLVHSVLVVCKQKNPQTEVLQGKMSYAECFFLSAIPEKKNSLSISKQILYIYIHYKTTVGLWLHYHYNISNGVDNHKTN